MLLKDFLSPKILLKFEFFLKESLNSLQVFTILAKSFEQELSSGSIGGPKMPPSLLGRSSFDYEFYKSRVSGTLILHPTTSL